MSTDLERDLGAWAGGELDRERLLATHGGAATGAVALHERLTDAAASTSVPDVDAGWAALLVAMAAPAPVVPLRRHVPRRRTVALLVAATLVLAGAAFAAQLSLGHRDAPNPSAGASVVDPGGSGSSFVGTSDRRPVPPPGFRPADPGQTGPVPSSNGDLVAGDGSGTGAGDASTSTDDPHDRDRGTGNDGAHDDRGGGNDGSFGSLPGGSNGHGH